MASKAVVAQARATQSERFIQAMPVATLRVILFTSAVTRCASGEHLLAFTLERFVQKLPTSRLSLSAVAPYFFFLTGSHSVTPFFHGVTP